MMAASTRRDELSAICLQDFKAADRNDQKTRKSVWLTKSAQLLYTVLDLIVDSMCLFTLILLRQLTLSGLRTISTCAPEVNLDSNQYIPLWCTADILLLHSKWQFSVLTIILYQITCVILFSYPTRVLQFQLSGGSSFTFNCAVLIIHEMNEHQLIHQWANIFGLSLCGAN